MRLVVLLGCACALLGVTASDATGRITHLFSIPAQHHPRSRAPRKPIIECQVTVGGTYRVCCIWNPDESPYIPGIGVLPIIGAWDCTASVNPGT